jgi:hypothetical protein
MTTVPHCHKFQCPNLQVYQLTARGGKTVKLSQVFEPLLVLAPVNSPTRKLDDRHEQPQAVTVQNQPLRPPQGESNFGDSSGPLFSLYSKITEEEDNKMTDRWQKDADGILIFVSGLVAILIPTYVNNLWHYRPVYFLLPWLHYLPCLSWISGQIHKIPPHSISRKSIRFSPIRTSPHHPHQSLPLLLYRHRSLLRDTPSG